MFGRCHSGFSRKYLTLTTNRATEAPASILLLLVGLPGGKGAAKCQATSGVETDNHLMPTLDIADLSDPETGEPVYGDIYLNGLLTARFVRSIQFPVSAGDRVEIRGLGDFKPIEVTVGETSVMALGGAITLLPAEVEPPPEAQSEFPSLLARATAPPSERTVKRRIGFSLALVFGPMCLCGLIGLNPLGFPEWCQSLACWAGLAAPVGLFLAIVYWAIDDVAAPLRTL